jgi:AraC-like DNA-binding protein
MSNSMLPAAKVFAIEDRPADSPFVSRIWRTTSAPDPEFISIAASYWQLVVWRQAGEVHVTLRGPETAASAVPIPAGAEFTGIEFAVGAYLTGAAMAALVDRDVTFPAAGAGAFGLDGEAWEIPDYDNAEGLVQRLAREGLIAREPMVADLLQGAAPPLSQRPVERRVRRATGLTLGHIRQIERAKAAAAMLEQGASILDTVARAGYADQPHLTRSLRRFLGRTPGQIAAGRGA